MTQVYDIHNSVEYVIRGNSVLMKCEIPSFMTEFLEIVSWRDDVQNVYTPAALAGSGYGTATAQAMDRGRLGA